VRSAQFYDKIRMEDKVMALMLDEEMDENVTTIKVIGVGGGGGNAAWSAMVCRAWSSLR
jgi:hypothetical protein